jgi:hypothetical protein
VPAAAVTYHCSMGDVGVLDEPGGTTVYACV